jgi:hypothetical protein
MLTDEQIEAAKCNVKYSATQSPHHEHNDCIRIAYEWLDAQPVITKASSKGRPLKHLIEKWGGRYISRSDVEVAAFLHAEIRGDYPLYNIGARLVEPSIIRLEGISEAFTHRYRRNFDPSVYSTQE